MSAQDEPIKRSSYLITKLLMSQPGNINVFMATEAVYSTAIEHPEWDLDEVRTWAQWESMEVPTEGEER